jgi:nitroreductase
VACDGTTSISKIEFFTMLDKTLPREGVAPFDVGLGSARVHLFLFVHRVRDLRPGLYMFVRSPEALDLLKSAALREFVWKPVEDNFPLYLLAEGQYTKEATAVSCQQFIAGEGAFSLGMIAQFRIPVEEASYLYRHLFWECGMIGQVLYLEAEAHGIRSTGIGCFFDDPVHEMLGLLDNEFQSLYHFTVGGAVDDPRLQTWPAYHHLKGGS